MAVGRIGQIQGTNQHFGKIDDGRQTALLGRFTLVMGGNGCNDTRRQAPVIAEQHANLAMIHTEGSNFVL